MFSGKEYTDKIINEESLLKLIRPGNRIFISSGPAIPARSVNALTRSPELENYDLEFIQLFNLGDHFSADRCEWNRYRLITFRTGESVNEEVCHGRIDFIPSNLMEIPYIFATGSMDVDVAIITTSVPDKRGYMSLGIANDVAHIAARTAPLVIAEVNSGMPVTYGETSIHVSQVNHVIETDHPLLEREVKDHEPELDRIGWHMANLIPDGSTVVLHVGRIFDAVAHHLKDKKNLGIFTNVVSDWVIDLIESGAISNERDRNGGGKITTSYCYGTRALYDYVDHNQMFGFYPIGRTANPNNFRGMRNLVSIMNVERIDITAGKIVFHAGDNLLSGYESKFNFAVGAAFSGSGKVIFALRSTDRNGSSNIVVSHDHGNDRVRSTLSVTRYVVTEYGVANLFGKSIRERALAMIDIAHPSHREELLRQAKEAGYLFPDQIYKPENAINYPLHLETRKTFRDGLELLVRPIKPSDEDMMRRLFYQFSDEARYLRYFTSVRTMPHRNMQKYIHIDYTTTLSLVAVLQKGHSERIIAEARYAAYPGGEKYDMAFLVDEEFQGKGIASFLMNYLIEIAADRGVKKLCASILSQNEKMLAVFGKASVRPSRKIEDGIFELEFDLTGGA